MEAFNLLTESIIIETMKKQQDIFWELVSVVAGKKSKSTVTFKYL